MAELQKFFRLLKIDEAAHLVWGLSASETPDSDDEICDYPAAKAAIKKWSDETLAKTSAAGQEISLGNLRVMHQLQVGGKAVKIEYHDDTKEVWVGSEPANDEVWHLLKGGFLTGYSIGGGYDWKRPEGKYTRYAPTIGEISYVDRPANPDANFAYVKADGTTELRKFAKPGPEEVALLEKLKKSETPLAKLSPEDLDRLEKAIETTLQKEQQKILAALEAAKGSITMKVLSAEELQKASREDLLKQVEELQKGHTPILEHLHTMHKAVSEHHADMCKAHAAHMEAMHDHINKCHKALGHDGMKTEKTEVKKTEEPTVQPNAEVEELQKTVTTLTTKIDELMSKTGTDATAKTKLMLVGRDGKEIKKAESDTLNTDQSTDQAVGF